MAAEPHQRRTRTEILTARQGLAAGVGAGLALALVAGAGWAATGDGPWIPVNAAGSFFLGAQPIPADFAGAVSYVGVSVLLLMGGLLGVLYATAQEPLDNPSLLIIAVYYGGVTWIVSTFALLSWLNPAVRAIWQSWPVLLGHLVYGALLGLCAVARNPFRGPKA